MKSILVVITLSILTTCFLSAQSNEKHGKNKEQKKEFYKSLSESQKNELDAIRQLRKDHKSDLKATFSNKQLFIVNNENLSRGERRKILKPTLNKEQKEKVKDHKELMKRKNEQFKSTLSDIQLVEYENLRKKGRKKGRGGRKTQ